MNPWLEHHLDAGARVRTTGGLAMRLRTWRETRAAFEPIDMGSLDATDFVASASWCSGAHGWTPREREDRVDADRCIPLPMVGPTVDAAPGWLYVAVFVAAIAASAVWPLGLAG